MNECSSAPPRFLRCRVGSSREAQEAKQVQKRREEQEQRQQQRRMPSQVRLHNNHDDRYDDSYSDSDSDDSYSADDDNLSDYGDGAGAQRSGRNMA